MTIWDGVWAGLIQGLTEFLPVSSSGHLVLLGKNMTLFSEVVFHAATLLAVLVVFFHEAAGVFFSPLTAAIEKKQTGEIKKQKSNLQLLLIIITASIPAALLGLLLHDQLEALLQHPAKQTITGLLLLVTGAVLLSTRFIRNRERFDRPGLLQGVLIGTAQAAALLPGISRSGMTIAAAVHLGIKRQFAGVFSFLLSVPAVAGATLLQIKKVAENPAASGFLPAYHIAGFLAAFLSGLIALKLLLAVVRSGRLHWFSGYCAAAGLAAIIL